MSTITKCRYCIAGQCGIGENQCWFTHNEDDDSLPPILTGFKCGFGGNEFRNEKEFMKRIKSEHINSNGCFRPSNKITRNDKMENENIGRSIEKKQAGMDRHLDN